MSKRVKRWAKAALAELRAALGGKCAMCGTTDQLEFDCIEPRGHKHHAGSTDQRACFYRKESRMGNLQLLCAPCHAIKSLADLSNDTGIDLESTIVLRPVKKANKPRNRWKGTKYEAQICEELCEQIRTTPF